MEWLKEAMGIFMDNKEELKMLQILSSIFFAALSAVAGNVIPRVIKFYKLYNLNLEDHVLFNYIAVSSEGLQRNIVSDDDFKKATILKFNHIFLKYFYIGCKSLLNRKVWKKPTKNFKEDVLYVFRNIETISYKEMRASELPEKVIYAYAELNSGPYYLLISAIEDILDGKLKKKEKLNLIFSVSKAFVKNLKERTVIVQNTFSNGSFKGAEYTDSKGNKFIGK